MNESKLKKTIKRPKRKLRVDRFILSSMISAGIILGANYVIKNLIEKGKNEPQPIYTQESLEALSNFVSPEFDNFQAVRCQVNEPITLYMEKQYSDEKEELGAIGTNLEIEVYNQNYSEDLLGNRYYYCKVSEQSRIGLINASDLQVKTTQLEVKESGFNQIYKINTEPHLNLSIKTKPNEDAQPSGFFLQNGDIVFVDTKNAIIDSENNAWVAIRTNSGKIGYKKVDKSLQRIDDGILVEISKNADNEVEIDSYNLNQNEENMIIDIQPGDRVVVIGEGSSDKTSLILSFNEKGIAVTGEVLNDLLKEVVLIKSKQRISLVENVNLDAHISNWLQDYQSGAYGIDISASMTPERIRRIIKKFSRCKIWHSQIRWDRICVF